MLADFFANLRGAGSAISGVTDRAFVKARSLLHVSALWGLNDDVVARAEASGLVGRWQGLRLVAADGSVFMPAVAPRVRPDGGAASPAGPRPAASTSLSPARESAARRH
jgi:hypothetical protein